MPWKEELGEEEPKHHQGYTSQVANDDERNACADHDCHDCDLLPGLCVSQRHARPEQRSMCRGFRLPHVRFS
jgi:hypothetical protein